MENRESLIAAFLLHQPGSSDEHFDAVEELDEIVKSDPAEALKVVQELLHRAKSDEFRSYIAAGPLEDIIRRSNSEFFCVIEGAAELDANLKRALSEVWVGEEVSSEIRDRLARLAKER